MARKLLMNNYVENGLMPLTDGLICWLDGRDYINGETVWKDRSGNDNNADVINCQGTGFSLRTTDNTSEFLVNRLLIDGATKQYTLEIYFSGNYNPIVRNENIILANKTKTWRNSTSLYLDLDRRLFYDMGSVTILPVYKFTINTPYYISITKKDANNRSCFLNGNYFNKYLCGTEGVSFLGNCGHPKIKGDYYSIRLYDRILTEEEIQQNYLYEKSIQRGE